MKASETRIRIKQLEHEIQVRQAELALLKQHQGVIDLLKATVPDAILTRRNIAQLATLARVKDCLRYNSPLTIEKIMEHVMPIIGDGVKPSTLRSHMHRLKKSGYLHYDHESKTWSLPP